MLEFDREYVAIHPQPPRGSGPCPFCQHPSSFGIGLISSSWECFNADHNVDFKTAHPSAPRAVRAGECVKGANGAKVWTGAWLALVQLQAWKANGALPTEVEILSSTPSLNGQPYYDARGQDEIVYVIPAEGFVLREPDGTYDAGSVVGETAAAVHLQVVCGLPGDEVQARLKHRNYAAVSGVSCAPGAGPTYVGQDGKRYLNTYVPTKLTRRQGTWPRLFAALCLLAGVDPGPHASFGGSSRGTIPGSLEAAAWLWNWICAKVQQPDLMPHTVPIIGGGQGVFKTQMGELVRMMIGLVNTAAISANNLIDEFNSEYITKLFINVSEMSHKAGGRADDQMKVLDKLKNLVTERWGTMKTPHQARIPVEKRLAIWITTNHRVSLRLEDDQRRFVPFWVHGNAESASHKAMLKGLFDQRTNQLTTTAMLEVEAMYYDALEWAVDWNWVKVVYQSPCYYDEVLTAGRTSVEEFIHRIADGDEKTFLGKWVGRWVGTLPEQERHRAFTDLEEGVHVDAVYGAYQVFAKREGFQGITAKTTFGTEWNKVLGSRFPKTRQGAFPREYYYKGLFADVAAADVKHVMTVLPHLAFEELLEIECSVKRALEESKRISNASVVQLEQAKRAAADARALLEPDVPESPETCEGDSGDYSA